MNETAHISVNIKRVFDVLPFQTRQYPQNKALNCFTNGDWQGLSISEIQQKVDALSAWFLENGYEKGDKVAIIPILGRPDWMIIDFACQQIGVIIVPIHPTASDKECAFILEQTEAKLCLTADIGLYYKMQLVLKQHNINCGLFHIDAEEPTYFEALDLKKPTKTQAETVIPIKNSIQEDDILTIMYTSGTSGIPKGVVLTHANMVSNILSTMAIFPLRESEHVLSLLPFSHILERSVCYAYVACGVEEHGKFGKWGWVVGQEVYGAAQIFDGVLHIADLAEGDARHG